MERINDDNNKNRKLTLDHYTVWKS